MACSHSVVPDASEPGVVSRLEQSLVRERNRLRALLEVGRLLDSTLPRDQLLTHVLAAAGQVTEAERATLYLVEPERQMLVSYATEGGPAHRIELGMSEGLAGYAARTRSVVVVPDAYSDPRFVPTWDQRTGFRTRSVVAAPMITPYGQVVGVLQVLNRKGPDPFDADDVAMLEALAAQAAVSIESAARMQSTVQQNRALTELRGRLERTLHERNTLLEMEQLLARTESLDEFVRGALAGLARACGAARAVVALADDITGRIEIRAVHGEGGCSDGTLLTGRGLHDDSLAAQAVAGGLLLCEHAPNGLRAELSCLGAGALTLMAVPVPGAQIPIGVIELRDRAEGVFTEDDRDLATLVAANLSTGVELVRVRLERERTLRLAAVGQTLSNVLHDIRTPMTIIAGYAQWMPTVESQHDREILAEKIVRQFGQIQAMVGEVLAFVRGESQLLLQKVILDGFFGELTDVLVRELAPRKVKVQYEMHAGGSFRMDTAKITRLVHNLARNAADALTGRSDGVFVMRVERQDEDLVLTFEDNGPGISDRVRARLFTRFVTEGKVGGTGLGLAIVKKIVDEHEGTLAVETGAWGSRFVVRLPQQVPGRAQGSTSAPPPAMTERDDDNDDEIPTMHSESEPPAE